MHENTIYAWLDQGTIFPHAFKIKKGWRIPSTDVERAKRRDFEPPARSTTTPPARVPSGFVSRWK